MNIQSNLRKVYNAIKSQQIKDEDLNASNASRGIYMAGMLHSAKIFMNLYNGDMNEKTFEYELEELQEKVND